MSYNGWSNHATWATKLWIDNEEGSQRYWQREAERLREDPSDLAKALDQEHMENIPEVSGVYSDLLIAALQEVDWQEIAESMIGDLDPIKEEE